MFQKINNGNLILPRQKKWIDFFSFKYGKESWHLKFFLIITTIFFEKSWKCLYNVQSASTYI